MANLGASQGTTPGANWKATRLLVFGLDDQFRFMARQTFRKLSVRDVETFSNPADTPILAARGTDLILIDLGAEAENGLAVIERLRRPAGNPFENVLILVVALSSQKEVVERAKAFGIEGTIPKPISGHELVLRVAETLANPRRLPIPSVVPAKPKMNFIKLPDPPAGPAVEAGAAASANPERPDRGGPWSALAGARDTAPPPAPAPAPPPAPAPAPAPTPPPAPAPAPPPTPAPAPPPPRPAAAAKPTPRPFDMPADSAGHPPAERGQGLESRPRPLPGGGKLDLGDLAPLKPREASTGIEVAGLRPDLEAEAKRRLAEKRRQQWKEAMTQSGRAARQGNDVAGLDLSAVVADHMAWLQSNGAEGKRAAFTGMDLAGADLADAILANATFREVNLSDACLAGARLDGSDFRYAILEAADLGGANLGVAALRHAKLRLCNLENAVLRGADLSGAILTGARLAGADVKGAILIGADLRQADLSKVEGLTSGQIEKSLCDMSTRLPPGVVRPGKTE